MKAALLLSALAATFFMTTAAPHVRVHGTHRWKREASPEWDLHTVDSKRGGTTYDFDYHRSVFENDNAKLDAGIHAHRTPDHDWSYTGRAQGSYQLGSGQLSAGISKPLNGPNRESYNVGYQHKIWEGKDGSVSVGVGGSKTSGQDWQKEAVIKGNLSFK